MSLTADEYRKRVKKALEKFERKPHWLAKRASRTVNEFVASRVRRELKEWKKENAA